MLYSKDAKHHDTCHMHFEYTNEYDIHGTVSQILSSQFLCPSLSVSQWHQRVPRLGSGCPHR